MKRAVTLGAATLMWVAPVCAQQSDDADRSANDEPNTRTFEVELGGDFALPTRDIRSKDGDDVSYSRPVYRGFHVAPRYRIDPRWAVGVVGASNRVISPVGETGYVHSAASAGLEFGNDAALNERVALSFVVRGLYTAFGDEDDGRGLWMWAGLAVQFQPVRMPPGRTASR